MFEYVNELIKNCIGAYFICGMPKIGCSGNGPIDATCTSSRKTVALH